jgi:hypothetical protein
MSTSANEPLDKALADAVDFLETRQIPFAVIGGIAATVRGEFRATADLDFVLDVAVEDAVKLASNLEGTYFEPLFPGVSEVVERTFILPLRHKPTGLTVDLALGLSRFEQTAISRAERVQFGSCIAPVVTSEDLVLMKLFAGRPRDIEDVEGILALRHEEMDWNYLQNNAVALGEVVAMDLITQLLQMKERLTDS